MEPLPHGLLVLSSSKPLTGRTGHNRLRDASVYWNYMETSLQPGIQESSTGQGLVATADDMPCRTPSIEATTDPAGHHLDNRHLAGDRLRITSLRIAPGHSRLQSSRLNQDYINHRLLGKTNQMGTHLLRYIPFGNQLDYSLVFPLPTFYVQPSTFSGPISMRSSLATINVKYHGSICTSSSICVFIVFAIYPKPLNIPFTLLPIFHRNISP